MERDSFCEYAEKYKDTIYRVALNMSGNVQDAEDAVQDVLMKLYLAERPFEGDEHVKNWLIRVTVNYCKNLLRAGSKRAPMPPENLAASVPFEAEEQIALFSAVMGLPERYRTVLYLYYYEDYSVREIASILGIRESAVTTRLSRGRDLLRDDLREGAL